MGTRVALLAITALGIGVVIGLLAWGGDDDEGASVGGVGEEFVQSAHRGSFAKRGDAYELTLEGVSRATVAFTDRPERDSWALGTAEFADLFPDAFADDPPNATLSSLEQGVGEFTVELTRPRYDAGAGTLSYLARPIGAQDVELPRSFGAASLFIDAATVGPASCTQGREASVWVCTLTAADHSVAVEALLDDLGGLDSRSYFCLQAWGGAGGNGGTAAGGSTGRGGHAGYARTITTFDAKTTLTYMIGQSGSHSTDSADGGGGGTSTIVGTAPLSASISDAVANQSFANAALLIAGGGGGGSYSDIREIGHDGGAGGIAVATKSADATGAGGDGHGHGGGAGGSDGTGAGSGGRAGDDGFGGLGGMSSEGIQSRWTGFAIAAGPADGSGGWPDVGSVLAGPLYSGGAGGGGYGGGQAGPSRESNPGAGGGGGGSLAKRASLSDTAAPPECTTTPAMTSTVRVVIFTP